MSPRHEAQPPTTTVEELSNDPTDGVASRLESGPSSLDALEPTPVVDARDEQSRGGVRQAEGRVVRLEGDVAVIRSDDMPGVEIRARRAVSCLVEPELHDLVLVALARQRPMGHILAVLEREAPSVALALRGDLDIRLRDGRVRVAAQKGIDLVSPESIDFVAGRVAVHANGAKLVASELVALASQVIAELTNVQLEGAVLDKVFERVSERVQRSIRSVDEIDQLRARQVDYAAEESMTLRSDNTLVTGKDVVQIDNDPVHYG